MNISISRDNHECRADITDPRKAGLWFGLTGILDISHYDDRMRGENQAFDDRGWLCLSSSSVQ